MALTIPITVGQVSGGNYQPVSSLSSTNFTIRLASSTGTTISYATFSNEGNGNYVFGGFTIPASSTAQGAEVNVAINGTLRPELGTFVVYANGDEPWTAQKTIDLAAGRLDRGVIGQSVAAGCDTIWGQIQYDDTVSEASITGINRKGLIHKGYVDDKFSITASITGLASGAYLPLSGGTINGAVTYNATPLTFVATKINGQAVTADLRTVSVSSMYIYNNLGTFPTGDHFTYGFFNTDQTNVQVFSMGCESSEAPYIDFHNVNVKGFTLSNNSISSALTLYMPLTGGVFSGSVTANGPRFKFGNTTIDGTGASANLASITARNGSITSSSISASVLTVNDVFQTSLICGTESLSDGSGTRTVTTSKCHSNSLVFLTPFSALGTPGHLYLADVSNGSFTVVSSAGGADDNLLFHWHIINR